MDSQFNIEVEKGVLGRKDKNAAWNIRGKAPNLVREKGGGSRNI